MDELEPGTLLGERYCVERLIAQGRMSRLYQGHPLQGAGPVAIRQLGLPEAGVVASEDVAQFQKEYDVLHSLDHSGLAHALDFFEEDGRHYLVEEFVPGETLEEHIQGAGKIPGDEAVRIMEQVLRVLEYLHGHGVIYRDLRPQNVILQPQPSREADGATTPILPYTVRLVDFGATRRWKMGAAAGTSALGTPRFAPPEHHGKTQPDARSDVYGAGVLMHYMLTGRPPDPDQGWVFQAPHHLVGISRDLGLAVLRAVQVDPGKRFQDAREMRLALVRAAGRQAQCRRCGTELPGDGKTCAPCAARRASWSALGSVLVLLSALVVLAMILVSNARRDRAREQFTACRCNVKNLGTAMEMYSIDNGGRFPLDSGWGYGGGTGLRLPQAIVPTYLKEMPTCPAAGTDTYSKSSLGAYSPDSFTIVCGGNHHDRAGQGPNYPQYTSTQGLIPQ